MFSRLKPLLFFNQTTTQTIAKNTFWLFFGQIISRLLRAILIICAARILGVNGYGLFSFALSFIMLFSLFSDVGIGPLLTRELSKNQDNEEKQKYLSTSFYLKIGLTVIIAFIVIAALFLIPDKTAIPIICILLLMLIFNILGSIFLPVSQSLEKMELEAAYNIINSIIVVACGLIFLKLFPSPIFLSIAYAAGSLLALIFIIFSVKKFIDWKKIVSFFDVQSAKKIINWAWPLAITGLTASIMSYAGSLILGWFNTIGDVGIYNAAIKIPTLFFVPISLIATATFPALNRFAFDKEKFAAIIKQSIQTSLYLAFPVITGGILLAKPIINFVFGEAYQAAYPIFQIVLPAVFAVYVTNILNNALFACNFQKKSMFFFTITAILNIILNCILIINFRLGYFGATISILVCEYLIFFLIIKFFTKTMGIFPFVKEIKKPLLAAVLMGTFILIPQINHLHILLSISLAALLYIAILYILKADIFKQLFFILKITE